MEDTAERIAIAPEFAHEKTAVLSYGSQKIEIPYSIVHGMLLSMRIDSGTAHFAAMASLIKALHRMMNEMGRDADADRA